MTSESSADAFDEAYDRIGWAVAAEFGFAVPVPSGTELSAGQRLHRVQARAARAYESVVALQQFLLDEDNVVREVARGGLRHVVYRAYTGDQSERAWRSGEQRLWTDRLLERLLTRHVNPDVAEPAWRQPVLQRRIRRMAILGAFLCAIAGAGLLGTDHPMLALVAVSLAATLDIADGAFARVVHMRDAHLRWLSCIASHAGDTLLIGGVAYGAEFGPSRSGYGGWLLAAVVVTLFGSLVRTSALQAAYRFWRSPRERYVRYLAVVGFCVLASAGEQSAGIILATTALSVFGVLESARVIRAVEQVPAAQDGGLVFIDSANAVHALPMTDDEDPIGWTSTPSIPAPDVLIEAP
ncbi:MAG: hypothetical protein QOC82_2971 [Frankiaceae bacterium]|nr:hypothetical protein [Frankiaceae bacterium]